ncbi:hypothetical protein OG203_24950 [Nocardia sp. NBC_01499]|uniref:hypothetical protein n=1 Tax=Nocardia sp. NBC_01499 TaxID=2903597 RepID=UPI00386D7F31
MHSLTANLTFTASAAGTVLVGINSIPGEDPPMVERRILAEQVDERATIADIAEFSPESDSSGRLLDVWITTS